jgi:hypothetical protein
MLFRSRYRCKDGWAPVEGGEISGLVDQHECLWGQTVFTRVDTTLMSTDPVPNCVRVQCTDLPAVAPVDSGLVARGYHGGYVDDGATVAFGCPRGTRFAGNFSQVKEEVTCNAEANEYQPALTGVCVESEMLSKVS